MALTSSEIRGVMIPVSGGRVLLPNASVAEVITLTTPEAVSDAPAWLLGRIPWRGWRLPLVAYAVLIGQVETEGSLHARVAVLKALGAHPRMPYLALLTQGFPRLVTLTPDVLMPAGDSDGNHFGVRSEVLVRDEPAHIPDLQAIEARLLSVLNIAA